jgi:hypothetical protein
MFKTFVSFLYFPDTPPSVHGGVRKKNMVSKQNGKEAHEKFNLIIIYHLKKNEDKRTCCLKYLVLI